MTDINLSSANSISDEGQNPGTKDQANEKDKLKEQVKEAVASLGLTIDSSQMQMLLDGIDKSASIGDAKELVEEFIAEATGQAGIAGAQSGSLDFGQGNDGQQKQENQGLVI
jgi:hypothetical protein